MRKFNKNMETNTFIKALIHILKDYNGIEFQDITSDDDMDCILVTCTDDSVFNIQVRKSPADMQAVGAAVKNSAIDLEIEQYILTHTREDFLNEIYLFRQDNSEYFEIFVILWKIMDMGIISFSTMNNLMERVRSKLFP